LASFDLFSFLYHSVNCRSSDLKKLAMSLFLFQILMGMFTAHYAVEAEGFYGLPLSDFLPYAASRTWHLQLGIYWIATCWLAAGLYFAPRFGQKEPKYQGLGNLVLLIALVGI
jgi:nitric oxide reductase subunit B